MFCKVLSLLCDISIKRPFSRASLFVNNKRLRGVCIHFLITQMARASNNPSSLFGCSMERSCVSVKEDLFERSGEKKLERSVPQRGTLDFNLICGFWLFDMISLCFFIRKKDFQMDDTFKNCAKSPPKNGPFLPPKCKYFSLVFRQSRSSFLQRTTNFIRG